MKEGEVAVRDLVLFVDSKRKKYYNLGQVIEVNEKFMKVKGIDGYEEIVYTHECIVVERR